MCLLLVASLPLEGEHVEQQAGIALHGGPLCYTQIGGLCVATFITLLLVPVLYAIFVLDLKLLKWEEKEKEPVLTGTAAA